MHAPLVLGLDLGTSALKAVLANAQGEVLASGGAPLTTRSTLPGQAEQDVAQWLDALQSVCGALELAAADATPGPWRARVAAIGLAGQLPTLVLLGEHGVLGPAITWEDARADAAAATVIGDRRRALYERTGMPIDGRYLAPMLHSHGQTHGEAVRAVLSAKDYLCYALTGVRVTDPSTAAGYALFDLVAGEFSTELCALWSVPGALLPQVRPAHAFAGPLSTAGARLLGMPGGIPVTVGAADSVSSAFAMTGLQEAGRVCVAMGSSTVILDAVRERRLDARMRYLLTPHVEPRWYAREMDLLATGTGHRWLAQLLGWTDQELVTAAAQSVAGAHGVRFRPYLAGGEQGALWNPTLRGAVTGLTLQTRASDLARAFLEGVGFEIRRCVEVLAETQPVREIVLAGHLAAAPVAVQLLADILGRAVQPFPCVSPAALGAALGALHGLDRAPARQRRAGPAHVTPGAERALYEHAYARYLAEP